jgi:hypothetical protein
MRRESPKPYTKAKPEELPISTGMPFKIQLNVVGVPLIGLYKEQTQACRVSEKRLLGEH